jgi:hypothetical protein
VLVKAKELLMLELEPTLPVESADAAERSVNEGLDVTHGEKDFEIWEVIVTSREAEVLPLEVDREEARRLVERVTLLNVEAVGETEKDP